MDKRTDTTENIIYLHSRVVMIILTKSINVLFF